MDPKQQALIPYLMELFKSYYPTFSDDPGGGNLEHWQFKGSLFPPAEWDREMLLQNLLNKYGKQPNQMGLERFLMENRLYNHQLDQKFGMQQGPRYGFKPSQPGGLVM